MTKTLMHDGIDPTGGYGDSHKIPKPADPFRPVPQRSQFLSGQRESGKKPNIRCPDDETLYNINRRNPTTGGPAISNAEDAISSPSSLQDSPPDSSLHNPGRDPVVPINIPALIADKQSSWLYVYKDHAPFPALVEWPDVVQDHCYLAGLWRADLWFGLSWLAASRGLRTLPYRAPSWSWASLDGAVLWPRTNMLWYLREEDSLANTEYLELLEARTNVLGSSAFGHVRSGRIVVWGSMVDIPFFDEPYEQGYRNVAWSKWEGIYFSQPISSLHRDEMRGISPFSRCVVLDQETKLIVERVTTPPSGEVYRRVGVWIRDAHNKHIWDMAEDAPKQVITLI